jgi:hypothetical protein
VVEVRGDSFLGGLGDDFGFVGVGGEDVAVCRVVRLRHDRS